jgi:hypothetical protein
MPPTVVGLSFFIIYVESESMYLARSVVVGINKSRFVCFSDDLYSLLQSDTVNLYNGQLGPPRSESFVSQRTLMYY